MADYKTGDLVVFEGTVSYEDYTLVGKITEIPPFTEVVAGETVEYTDRFKLRTSANLPIYRTVPTENIVGLRENVEPDVETDDW